MPWLINASQLDKFRKSQKNVTILDASYHLPKEKRNAYAEYLDHRIVGARWLDLDVFSDPNTALPTMLIRDEKEINEKVGALGISNEHKIIFYDNSDLFSSCRALWMFKVFGHNPNQLYVLEGGYPAWERYGGKIDTGEPRSVNTKPYEAIFQARYLRSLMQMKANLLHPTEQVVDLRHAVRYAGGPEMRAGLRSGHIPGSFCFPYTTMFEPDKRFKPLERIRKQLTGLGIDLNYPIITTCGSGITSAILNFVLDLLNHTDHSIYDGSWSEWGAEKLYPGEASLNERPVETSLQG